MGVSMPGAGGKRGLDFELNLVPFIDLLSCCISFLLITAAWNQLAHMDTNQKVDKKQKALDNEKKPTVNIQVEAWGYSLHLPDEEIIDKIQQKGPQQYDREALQKKLQKFRDQRPGVTVAVISAKDIVPYREIATVMDVCLTVGLKDLSLQGAVDEAPGAPAVPN